MKSASFVAAASNSGKTTLIEKVVRVLKERGLHVAVVKHASKGFDLDRRGKDSWRFQQAGADSVLLVGPERIAIQQRIERQPTTEELLQRTAGADVVLFEGFKRDALAKIEVFRSGVSGERPLCLDDPSFLALASDMRWDAAVTQFDLNDAEGIARFIVEDPRFNR